MWNLLGLLGHPEGMLSSFTYSRLSVSLWLRFGYLVMPIPTTSQSQASFTSCSEDSTVTIHSMPDSTFSSIRKFAEFGNKNPFARYLSCASPSPDLSSVPLDGDCTSPVPETRELSDADRVHETILSNSGDGRDLEAALDSLDVQLTTELANDVIKRLRYEEKVAFRFFTWAANQVGFTHNHQTFNDMIDILSSTRYKSKQFGIVCDVLDHMKRKSTYSVSVDALLRILRNYTDKHLTHLSKFVKKKRVRVKTQPEINAFNLFIDSLCKCCMVKEAEQFVSRIKKKLTPDAQTYNILFFGWCRVRNPYKAMKVLEEMIDMGLPPDNFTYNTAISTFCDAGLISDALDLFEFMRTKGSTLSSPTAKTYCIMMVALAKAGQMDECYKILADMKSSGCVPDVPTYKELIEGMCLVGKVGEACWLLEELVNQGYPLDILTFNCFLNVLCKLKKVDDALGLCERMVALGCEPSVHTYNMLIAMFFEVGDPDRALDFWHDMSVRCCPRDVETYCCMMDGLFACGRSNDAFVLLDEVIDNGVKLPYQKFDSLLMRLSEIGNLKGIHRLSEHMKRFYNRFMERHHAAVQKKKSMSMRMR